MTDAKSPKIVKTASIIAFVIIISKIVGFIRDVIIANCYGAGVVSDAYFYAYQIPSLSLLLIGGVSGPIHSACVCVFSKMVFSTNQKPSKDSQYLFNSFLTSIFLIFSVVSVLVFIFAPQIMSFIISQGSTELIQNATLHLKIMSPIILIGGLVGVLYGILVLYEKFFMPNFTPIIMSLVIIGTLLLTSVDVDGKILAIATTIGAIFMLLFMVPDIVKIGFKFAPNVKFIGNNDLNSIYELLFPAILSSTIGQLHIYVDMFFTSSLEEGAWSAIGYANRIFQFPVGILTSALLVPLLPLFSKSVFKQDYEGIKGYFTKGINSLNFLAIPILMLIFLFGMDGITILFQRGAFDSHDTEMVVLALYFLSISIIPYIFRDTITRIFYAFGDSKTPFVIASCSVFFKFLFNYLLTKPFGIGGITLSTTLVTCINAIFLALMVRKKISLEFRNITKETTKILLVGSISFVIIKLLLVNFGTKFIFVNLTLGASAYCLLYLILCLIFKIDTLKLLLKKVMRY